MEEQTVIRAFSELNQWIDCIVIVGKKDADKAVEAINKGFDNFNDGVDDSTYSEAIARELERRKIDFSIIPGEIDLFNGGLNVTAEYERLAERLTDGFKNRKIIIF